METMRLLLTPERAGKFTARLETTGELIVAGTRQPLVDGARELLARGFDPATPLVMRHAGKAFDSFESAPIGKWAGWTYEERDRDGLKCARWMPRALHAGGQKSGSEPLGGGDLPAEDKSLVRSHQGGLAAWVPTGEPS